MRRWMLVPALFVALAASVAAADPPAHRSVRDAHVTRESRMLRRVGRAADLGLSEGRRSRSIGFAWHGTLERPARLRSSDTIRYVDEYAHGNHFFGTWELVQLIERAAARVSQRVPGAKLSMGELSAATGGDIDGHHSHESGRDADISFYVLDGAGHPVAPGAFVAFNGDGTARRPNVGYRFDDTRNWELVARLVTDPDARVQFIFVSNQLRRRLLEEGARVHASRAVLDRAATVLGQPTVNPHNNHFHVRIFCPPADRPSRISRSGSRPNCSRFSLRKAMDDRRSSYAAGNLNSGLRR